MYNSKLISGFFTVIFVERERKREKERERKREREKERKRERDREKERVSKVCPPYVTQLWTGTFPAQQFARCIITLLGS